jgi:hypothetical protein
VIVEYFSNGTCNIVFKGVKHGSNVGEDGTITDIPTFQLFLKAEEIVNSFLRGDPYTTRISMVVKNRTNKMKGVMLYERITSAEISLDYHSRRVFQGGVTKPHLF